MTKQKPGDALRAAGIHVMSPTEFLEHGSFAYLVGKLKNGRIDKDVAKELSEATGCTEQFWLNIQEAYDG